MEIEEAVMFGYICINKPELKVKEYQRYHAFYCGLCRTLLKKYGRLGQMTLSYDVTFLILLLSGLYEEDANHSKHGCLVHPAKKHDMLMNEITEYAADMNIALTYHKFIDNWNDERKLSGLAGSKAFLKKYRRIEKKYPRQCSKIEQSLKELNECEKRNETNLDIVSRCFGELMAEVFVYRQDQWEKNLRNMGFYLGKFIYLMDAYDDLEKDKKNNSYNPLIHSCNGENFEEEIRNILNMMMSQCSIEFEKLPIIQDVELLRNILYAGVWSKYDKIQSEKAKARKES